MPEYDVFDFAALDFRSLPAEQRALMEKRLIHAARRLRRQAIRESVVGLRAGVARIAVAARVAARRAAAAVVAGWRGYARWRSGLAAMAELEAFTDHELKDMGIRRSEIWWVIHHGDPRHAHDQTSIAQDAGPHQVAQRTGNLRVERPAGGQHEVLPWCEGIDAGGIPSRHDGSVDAKAKLRPVATGDADLVP